MIVPGLPSHPKVVQMFSVEDILNRLRVRLPRLDKSLAKAVDSAFTLVFLGGIGIDQLVVRL